MAQRSERNVLWHRASHLNYSWGISLSLRSSGRTRTLLRTLVLLPPYIVYNTLYSICICTWNQTAREWESNSVARVKVDVGGGRRDSCASSPLHITSCLTATFFFRQTRQPPVDRHSRHSPKSKTLFVLFTFHCMPKVW